MAESLFLRGIGTAHRAPPSQLGNKMGNGGCVLARGESQVMDLTELSDSIALARRRLAEYEAAQRAHADRPPATTLRLVVELEDEPVSETCRWDVRLEGESPDHGPNGLLWGATGHVDRPEPDAAVRRMVQLVEDHVFPRRRLQR